MRAAFIAILAAFLCSAARAEEQPSRPVQQAPESLTPAELMQRNGGSLFRAAMMMQPQDASKSTRISLNFCAVADPEPKAIKKHDVVTIIIREEAEMSSDGNSDLKKSADFDAKVSQWVKLKTNPLGVQGGAQGATPPEIAARGARNFKGEGKVDRTDTFNTRISAEVIDVKPNGTFAIMARKFMKHDEEEQEYILTGVCRAADLLPDNTVLSWQLSNLSIETHTKGAVSDTTKRGWIPKIMDFVNPF